MKLPVTVPPGWALNLKLAIEGALERLRSPKAEIYPTTTDLPKPNDYWNGRTVMVRDIGGSPGLAFCLDGAWFAITGSAI